MFSINRRKIIIKALLTALFISTPFKGLCKEKNKKESFLNSSTSPVEIKSDRVKYNIQLKKAVFEGNVKVVQGELSIFADRATVFFDDKKNIVKIVLTGLVKAIKNDIVLISNTAVYEKDKKLITISGKPKAWQGDNYLEGDVIIYKISSDELIVNNANLFITKEGK